MKISNAKSFGTFDWLDAYFGYFVKLIFRIWPIFWIVCFLVVITDLMTGHRVSLLFLVFNLSTIFGFIKPHIYMLTGAWSIGNEMVYCSLTPLMYCF